MRKLQGILETFNYKKCLQKNIFKQNQNLGFEPLIIDSHWNSVKTNQKSNDLPCQFFSVHISIIKTG